MNLFKKLFSNNPTKGEIETTLFQNGWKKEEIGLIPTRGRRTLEKYYIHPSHSEFEGAYLEKIVPTNIFGDDLDAFYMLTQLPSYNKVEYHQITSDILEEIVEKYNTLSMKELSEQSKNKSADLKRHIEKAVKSAFKK